MDITETTTYCINTIFLEIHTCTTREPGLATFAKEPLDSWSSYSRAKWYTAAPGTDHGEHIDLIPYDESDEDDIHHAQTPEQNWSPLSLSSSS